MAFQFQRLSSAFSGTKPGVEKRPRQKIESHLRFIRTLPCLISGRRPVEAAHIRFADMRYGKRPTGIAEKPDDHWVVPLHPDLHREQHAAGDELGWWKSKGIAPLRVALALWLATGDEDLAEQILRENRRA
jgi:hypothetical protein